ncbi:hypothetical protein HN592_03135 [Candidatus Woesearchaeota archaeon]|jgi:hypothetical protein|nr:hypothetical protein [Candidatus Woesearchaeota archaeon]MBT4368207.1 hypothetical protein [Candidatus Woesearchaeota archaeon]MBT4712696.1 hypothetical protein [Candidatus Woesearchaeota archaeon]MBT6639608.1 hypothetical protein [Candidatus Woesearchaeota archaeon]MBT7133780.1 hypothetical protein [Candidatus Woesearchaeota archaeon]
MTPEELESAWQDYEEDRLAAMSPADREYFTKYQAEILASKKLAERRKQEFPHFLDNIVRSKIGLEPLTGLVRISTVKQQYHTISIEFEGFSYEYRTELTDHTDDVFKTALQKLKTGLKPREMNVVETEFLPAMLRFRVYKAGEVMPERDVRNKFRLDTPWSYADCDSFRKARVFLDACKALQICPTLTLGRSRVEVKKELVSRFYPNARYKQQQVSLLPANEFNTYFGLRYDRCKRRVNRR